MLRLIIDVLLNAGLLYVIAALLPGVRLKSFGTAVAVAIVYGLLSYFLFWVIALITFIPMLLSFGLFGLVINTFLLWLTDQLLDDFEIRSLGMTFLMALLLTVGKIALRVIPLTARWWGSRSVPVLPKHPLGLRRTWQHEPDDDQSRT